MKRAKLLFSAIVSLLLAAVMAFTVTGCGKKGKTDVTLKPDTPDKPANELGITESSTEALALQYIEIVTEGRTVFSLGENFAADGLTVRAILLNPEKEATIEDIEGNLEYRNLSVGDYTVDSSDYNPNKVGTYTIYVSYTFGGVTRIADYKVKVAAVDPEVGGIQVKLADGKEDTITLSASVESVTVTKDMVAVYKMVTNDEGKVVPAEQPLSPDEYEVNLYLGSKLIEDSKVTENGVYSLIVYLVNDETNQNYLPVYVINPVQKIELDQTAGGVFEQGKSMKDKMTATWQFTVTYASGLTKTVKGDNAGVKITLDTNTVGEDQTATVTYTERDGKGGESGATCYVTYTIYKGEPVNYSVTYDVDSTDGTEAGCKWVAKWNGAEDTEEFITFNASALTGGKTDSKTTADGTVTAEYSYEFKADGKDAAKSKNLTINVSEATENVVIKYYVSHNSINVSDRTALVTKNGETVAQVTPQATETTPPNLEVITVNATAGTYVLTTNSTAAANVTMRVYMVEISYTALLGEQVETLKYRPEVGTLYAGDTLMENGVFRASISQNSEIVSYTVDASSKSTNNGSGNLPNRLKFAGSIGIANNEDVNNETTNMVKNAIKIESNMACTLTFYVRSSSGTGARLFQGYTFDETAGALYPLTAGLTNNVNPSAQTSDDVIYVLTFKIEAGTYYFGADGGVGIYGIDVAFS